MEETNENHFFTLDWKGEHRGKVELIDQTLLPEEEKRILCASPKDLWEAIQRLAVRGAPAIGCSAGYGAVLVAQELEHLPLDQWEKTFLKGMDYLASSRPTAVNLFWALERQKKVFSQNQHRSWSEMTGALLQSAREIHREDQEMCRAIGRMGATLVPDPCTALTHCNAGSLATGGMGTALSVFYTAWEEGKKIRVFADETRPLLQGARLTAFELQKRQIPTTVICDNMAGMLMAQGKIDLVVVGADRIAGNGDTANKIGTYSLAVLARYHEVPFYIAAPSSTFDLSLEEGSQIPIEMRKGEEVACFAGKRTAPEKVEIYNPAFDVTPAKLLRAIITEQGVIEPVNKEEIRKVIGSKARGKWA